MVSLLNTAISLRTPVPCTNTPRESDQLSLGRGKTQTQSSKCNTFHFLEWEGVWEVDSGRLKPTVLQSDQLGEGGKVFCTNSHPNSPNVTNFRGVLFWTTQTQVLKYNNYSFGWYSGPLKSKVPQSDQGGGGYCGPKLGKLGFFNTKCSHSKCSHSSITDCLSHTMCVGTNKEVTFAPKRHLCSCYWWLFSDQVKLQWKYNVYIKCNCVPVAPTTDRWRWICF